NHLEVAPRPHVQQNRSAAVAWIAALLLVPAVHHIESRRHYTLADVVRVSFSRDVDSLDVSLTALADALSSTDRDRVRAASRRARASYKHTEGVIEYYAPALAAAFNSRRQEVDDDDAPPPSTLAPSGFPALETLLGSAVDEPSDSARRVVLAMRPLVTRARA